MENIFDREACAIKQLLNDKHTLLEGYVTERLFYNQFLTSGKTPFSDGWWMTRINEKRLFFIVTEYLTEFECQIINKVPSPHECWQVYLREDQYVFSKGDETLTQREFIDAYNLKKLRNCMIATKDTRNIDRQFKSIEFFKNNSIMKKVATERRFANNFLTVYFKSMINVDFFTKKNRQINVIEVKYKYESRDGYFGINKGQMEMFRFFSSIGFNIYHFILYNHTKDTNTSVFGYLNLPNHKNWYYARINDTITHGIGIAPEMTSVSGGFRQTYYKIPFDKFKVQKIPLQL